MRDRHRHRNFSLIPTFRRLQQLHEKVRKHLECCLWHALLVYQGILIGKEGGQKRANLTISIYLTYLQEYFKRGHFFMFT